MLSLSRFNVLCAVGPSIAKTLLSITALSTMVPAPVHCASTGNGGGDDSDIFKMMAHKAREAMDSFTPDPALDIDPKGMYEAASKQAYEMISKVDDDLNYNCSLFGFLIMV